MLTGRSRKDRGVGRFRGARVAIAVVGVLGLLVTAAPAGQAVETGTAPQAAARAGAGAPPGPQDGSRRSDGPCPTASSSFSTAPGFTPIWSGGRWVGTVSATADIAPCGQPRPFDPYELGSLVWTGPDWGMPTLGEHA